MNSTRTRTPNILLSAILVTSCPTAFSFVRGAAIASFPSFQNNVCLKRGPPGPGAIRSSALTSAFKTSTSTSTSLHVSQRRNISFNSGLSRSRPSPVAPPGDESLSPAAARQRKLQSSTNRGYDVKNFSKPKAVSMDPVSVQETRSTKINMDASSSTTTSTTTTSTSTLNVDDAPKAQTQEQASYSWEDDDARVKSIRSTLQRAEEFRQWKVDRGLVPKIDPKTGRPIRDDSQYILTISAAVIAMGLFAIRIGGRVALISAVGLDFAAENPQYKEYIDQILALSDSLGDGADVALFLSAWILTKVFIFDAGAIVLALSSGILFHGVLEGALLSAIGSTLGSSVAYSLAKFDTPLRKGALSILQKYPALRGIDNVVAEDGLKAILTLRLAPILPIPIGAYNYIYGVTKVPYVDFAGGIFLGSLKPYLLDSYLGYFASQVVEGTVDRSGYEDLILVISLVTSALIGVFASQLAGESWNSIKREIEADKRRYKQLELEQKGYRVITSVFGIKLSKGLIDRQIASKKSAAITENLIESEFYGTTTMSQADVIEQMNLFEYIALQPALLSAFLKYSDPTIVASEGLYAAQISSDSPSGKAFNFEVAGSVAKNLWFLPVLSLLSGLTPAARIVAESHVSRMPDTPIAHDIDTFLLWPAIGNPDDRGLPPTVFQTPAAAITDELKYSVDWEAAKEVYIYYLTNSLLVSGLVALSLYSYLILFGTPPEDSGQEEESSSI